VTQPGPYILIPSDRRQPTHGQHTCRQIPRPVTTRSRHAGPVSREPRAAKTHRRLWTDRTGKLVWRIRSGPSCVLWAGHLKPWDGSSAAPCQPYPDVGEAMRVVVAGDRGYIGACAGSASCYPPACSTCSTARPVGNFPRRAPAPR